MCSSDLDEVARLADHLVYLQDGQVLASGETTSLLTRTDLPLAHGESAGAVLACTIQSHDETDQLTLTHFSGGSLTVPRQASAPGTRLRVRVQARDVSLTLDKQGGTSILNILPATVLSVSDESPGQAMVVLQVGTEKLLAKLTHRSARALSLAPGKAVWAQVKGVAVLG